MGAAKFIRSSALFATLVLLLGLAGALRPWDAGFAERSFDLVGIGSNSASIPPAQAFPDEVNKLSLNRDLDGVFLEGGTNDQLADSTAVSAGAPAFRSPITVIQRQKEAPRYVIDARPVSHDPVFSF
jgi:hypothetical protein